MSEDEDDNSTQNELTKADIRQLLQDIEENGGIQASFTRVYNEKESIYTKGPRRRKFQRKLSKLKANHITNYIATLKSNRVRPCEATLGLLWQYEQDQKDQKPLDEQEQVKAVETKKQRKTPKKPTKKEVEEASVVVETKKQRKKPIKKEAEVVEAHEDVSVDEVLEDADDSSTLFDDESFDTVTMNYKKEASQVDELEDMDLLFRSMAVTPPRAGIRGGDVSIASPPGRAPPVMVQTEQGSLFHKIVAHHLKTPNKGSQNNPYWHPVDVQFPERNGRLFIKILPNHLHLHDTVFYDAFEMTMDTTAEDLNYWNAYMTPGVPAEWHGRVITLKGPSLSWTQRQRTKMYAVLTCPQSAVQDEQIIPAIDRDESRRWEYTNYVFPEGIHLDNSIKSAGLGNTLRKIAIPLRFDGNESPLGPIGGEHTLYTQSIAWLIAQSTGRPSSNVVDPDQPVDVRAMYT